MWTSQEPGANYLFTLNELNPQCTWPYDLIFLFNNTFHKQVFLNYNLGFFWIGSTEKMGAGFRFAQFFTYPPPRVFFRGLYPESRTGAR